jgi:hypothetical protein
MLPHVPKETESSLRLGNGGWVKYFDRDWPDGLYLRFAPDEQERLRVVDLFASSDDGLNSDALRRLRLGRIEAMANEPDARAYLLHGITIPSPDLRRLASFYATTFGESVQHWVARSFQAQRASSIEPQPPPARQRGRGKSPKGLDGRLPISEEPPYSEDFYRKVARQYADRAERSSRPAEELALINDIPVRRIHSWVKEARKRGYLGSGRRGTGG